MRECGEVIEVKNGIANVMFKRTAMCKKCGACGIMEKADSIIICVNNALHAKIGDFVEIEFSNKKALLSSFFAYCFPLTMMLIGIVMGYIIPINTKWNTDVLAALYGIIMCIISFLILKLLNPFFKKQFTNTYVMVAIK